MTAPVFVVSPVELAEVVAGGHITLRGTEGKHAASVVRLTPGESAVVVDGAGRRAACTVEEVAGRDEVVFSVVSVIDEPQPEPSFTVVQALPKGERGELAVEVLTEAGVDFVVPWSAARCITQWRPDRAVKSHRKWVDASISAAKQSRRARHPEVATLASTREVVPRIESAALALVLDEKACESLGDVPVPASGEVVIVVGPEGGLTDDERAVFAAAGARAVRLGPTVLRTSTAGVVALAILLARTDRWGSQTADVEG